MSDAAIIALAHRLNRLERQNGRWRLVALVVLLGIAAAAVMGQASPTGRVLAAEILSIHEPGGRVRALVTAAAGPPGFVLFGADGKARAALRLLEDGSVTLKMHDPEGRERLNVAGTGRFPCS
jgi:hypothetical protein